MKQSASLPKTVGVIPARYASVRLPTKPLKHILGKPLLQWVVEGAKTSKLLSELIVATDHQEIFNLAESLGVKAVMTSPDCPTGTDRCKEAVAGLDYDVVLNIQGDEPLITGDAIDRLIEGLFDEKGGPADISTLVTTLVKEDLPNLNVVKTIADKNNFALYFSRWAIPFTRLTIEENPELSFKHIGVYGYRKDAFQKFCSHPPTRLEKAESLEQLRALWMGMKIKLVQVSNESVGVDTAEDVLTAEKLLQNRGSRKV